MISFIAEAYSSAAFEACPRLSAKDVITVTAAEIAAAASPTGFALTARLKAFCAIVAEPKAFFKVLIRLDIAKAALYAAMADTIAIITSLCSQATLIASTEIFRSSEIAPPTPSIVGRSFSPISSTAIVRLFFSLLKRSSVVLAMVL